jgi:hypothetical protein
VHSRDLFGSEWLDEAVSPDVAMNADRLLAFGCDLRTCCGFIFTSPEKNT